MTRWAPMILLLTALVAGACARDRQAADPWADAGGPGSSSSGEGAGAGSDSAGGPGKIVPWRVRLAEAASGGERQAAQDIAALLGQMTGETVSVEAQTEVGDGCVPASLQIELVADADAEPADGPSERWGFEELRCEDGVLVRLHGTGPLARQHAAYAWLHRLGVRFFHPERTFVPDAPRWGDEPRSVEMAPAFRFRGARPALDRPIELGDASAAERRAFERWQVANGGNLAVFAQGVERGMLRTERFHLHRSAPGMAAVVDPAAGRSEEDQMTAAVDQAAARGPAIVHFSFDGELQSDVQDADAVRRMTFVAEALRDALPDAVLLTTSSGVAGPASDEFGGRYHDLPKFAPDVLGIKLRPQMFFDLFRRAPVHGNSDYGELVSLATDQAPRRRIWHAPEAAWGRTFDIGVPLYLPVTLDARHRDIQGLAALLADGLDGHEVHGGGHEWGYWQNEWCALRMSVDLDYGLQGCLADLVAPMGPAKGAVKTVLEAAIDLQTRDLVEGDLLRWFVGTDPEIEAAAALGVKIHPLPPTPAAIERWSAEELDAWLAGSTSPATELERSAAEYADLVLRLHEVEADVPAAARPWFDEIRDGLTVTGLRATHALQVYSAAVRGAQARRSDDEEVRQRANADLEAARRTTELVRTIIAGREEAYRYSPLERATGGGPGGDEDDNWSKWPRRYLNRVHTGYHYTRIDTLVAELLAGGDQPVRADDVILTAGQPLALTIPDISLADPAADFGDGAQAAGRAHEHTYAEPGVYTVTVAGQRPDGPWQFAGDVAVTVQEWASPVARIPAPAGAEVVAPLLPGLVFGTLPAGEVAVGFDVAREARVPFHAWSRLTWALDAAGLPTDFTAPADIMIPMIDVDSGRTLAGLPLTAAVFQRPPAAGGGVASLAGALATDSLIAAVVGVGVFDEAGARAAVAGALGFTPETLPDTTDVRLEWDVPPPAAPAPPPAPP